MSTRGKWWLGALVAFVALWVWMTSTSSGPSGDAALYAAKDAVSDALKAPSTADFDLGGAQVGQKGDVWAVAGSVDAQNSFGAKLRSEYVCTLRKLPGGRFQVVELTLGGQQYPAGGIYGH